MDLPEDATVQSASLRGQLRLRGGHRETTQGSREHEHDAHILRTVAEAVVGSTSRVSEIVASATETLTSRVIRFTADEVSSTGSLTRIVDAIKREFGHDCGVRVHDTDPHDEDYDGIVVEVPKTRQPLWIGLLFWVFAVIMILLFVKGFAWGLGMLEASHE